MQVFDIAYFFQVRYTAAVKDFSTICPYMNPHRAHAILGRWVSWLAVASFLTCAPPIWAQKQEAGKGSKTGQSASTAKKAAGAQASKAARNSRSAQASTSGRREKAQTQRAGLTPQQRQRQARAQKLAPQRPSHGQLAGLHQVSDPLSLRSSVALVIDQDTQEVLLSKNGHAVLPIASLTKLMTGMVISQAQLPMDEMITISQDDVDTEKGSSSRLRVGATLSRGELLLLALMSSENRAAHALGRTYPGGMRVFVDSMNSRAQTLGMKDTRYVEPTGLSSRNQSSAQDLALLVHAASADPLLRDLSTASGHQVVLGQQTLQYNNTNRLVSHPEWEIGLQKTGYISEAGQCLVMQARVAGRKLIMVFLDSAGKLSRLGDAERVRRWLERGVAQQPLHSDLVDRRS